MVERDSPRRGSVFAPGAATVGDCRSGLILVILAGLRLLAGGSAAFRRRANGNFRAIEKLVEPIHSNHFLRFKTFDGGHGSIRRAGRNGPHGGGLITLDCVDKSALSVALNRWSGNQSRVVLRVDEQLDIDELAGEESIVRVIEDGLELQGSGGWVNDVIEGQQHAGCEFRAGFTVKSVDRQFLPLA